jgi:hypothetical protein
MKKISSPTSTFPLRASGRTGAGRPHTKESRREKTANNRKLARPSVKGQCLLTMRWLARVGCPINRSTTSHSVARSHPRLAFGCRPKGDQLAPGCRLGVEGPKGGKIKEKVEGTGQRQASEWMTITVSRCLGWVAASKRFEARAASLDVGTVRGKVSFEPAVSPAIPKLGG